MDNVVFLAALCHAGWNALVQVGLDPLSTATLIAIGSGLVALPFLSFAGLPASAAWPWLVASAGIHLFYFAALIESYRTGDLGKVYPIARGSAPLMTATATTFIVGEWLGLLSWSGSVVLVAGVILLSARRPRPGTLLPPRRRLRAHDRAHDLRLFGGRRHRRAARRQPECLFADVVRAQSLCDGALCAVPRRPRRHPGDAPIGGSALPAALCRCCPTARCSGR